MAYEVKYRAEFNDLRGSDWKVDILQDAFSGAITNLQCKDNPLVIYFDNESDDAFDSVRATKAELTVHSLTNFVLNDLYATEDRHFQVNIYKDEVLYMTGWGEVGNYSEPYDMPPYPVTIAITDGLETLKDILYDDDGEAYDGRMLESQIILDILGKIGATTFTEFVNIYETGMDNGTGDSPMDQLYIDVDVFTDMYCWEVLAEVFKKYNAYIRQIDGVFCIIRPAELTGATVYGRTFTAATVKSSTSITPQQLINRSTEATNILQVPGGALMIEPPIEKIIAQQDYGSKDNWINNGEFDVETFDEDTDEFEEWTNVPAITVKHLSELLVSEQFGVALAAADIYGTSIYQEFSVYAVDSLSDKFVIEFDYNWYNDYGAARTATNIAVQVRQGSNYLIEKDTAEAEWDTTPDYLLDKLPLDIYGVTSVPSGWGDGWINYKREFVGLPQDGVLRITLISQLNEGVYNCYRNIKIYVSSIVITRLKRPATSKYLTPHRETPSVMSRTNWYDRQYIEIKDIIKKEYEELNVINGRQVRYDYILGDVVGSGLDNILEQFAGSLAVGSSDTLALVASRFVTDHAAAYLVGGVVVTSNGSDIIFTSDTQGVDFTGTTSIANTDGNLDGSVENTQANAPAQSQIDTLTIDVGVSSGTADIYCNSVIREIAFDINRATSILNFYNDHAAAYLAAGVTLGYTTSTLTFTAEPGEPFENPSYIANTAGDMDGVFVTTQANITGAKRIDTITLTGSTGTANITCDANTEEASFVDATITPTATWNRRGETDNKALLEIIAEEIAFVYSRPKQLVQMPIIDKAAAMSIDLSGNFQDGVNVIGEFMRCFVANRAKFEVRPRRWEIDLFEIGQGSIAPLDLTVKYGFLYNWYAASEINYLLGNTGWHVPTNADFATLYTYLGGQLIAGGKLKETGLAYWNTPNTGATNEVGFNARGTGFRRHTDGVFVNMGNVTHIWTNDAAYIYYDCEYNDAVFAKYTTDVSYKVIGNSVRLIKDSTTLSHGETSTYTGNDGRVYRTICIGTQEWLADNLCETKFRSGQSIPYVTDAGAWAALTNEAYCVYDNDLDNAYIYEAGEITADSTIVVTDSTVVTADGGIL